MLGRAFAITAILGALAISKERVMAAPPPPDFAKAVTFIFWQINTAISEPTRRRTRRLQMAPGFLF